MDELRAFLKPKGTNPEVDSAYYELSSQVKIHGMWNCEVLSLGFKIGTFSKQLLFRPIDQTRPIVFALDNVTSGCCFMLVDGHVDPERVSGGMHNYKLFQTDDFIVDCSDGAGMGSGKPDYWSITSDGLTFAHVERNGSFPDTWTIHDCGLLCAFIGGDITANELRAHCYKNDREVVKEERREEHIRRLSDELGKTSSQLSEANLLLKACADLMRRLSKLTRGHWPWISKATVNGLLNEPN